MIEEEILKVLSTESELTGKVFYANAPKQTDSPYCVYVLSHEDNKYILDGVTGNKYYLFDINTYCCNSVLLRIMSKNLMAKLLNLLGVTLGDFKIQSVKVSSRDFYDSPTGLYRNTLDLEIYI